MRRLTWSASGRLAVGLLLLAGLAGPAAAAERDLLVHAAGDGLWVAAVVPRPPEMTFGPMAGGSQPTSTGPAQQTMVWARANRPKQPWRVLSVIPGRVTSIAARESQLAVLMADGTWLTVFADGSSATGEPLPADGRVVALGDDGHALWAVGSVVGGRAAATRATTGPTTTATAAAKLAERLVVFCQDGGRWSAVAELPADVGGPAADELSLAVVGRSPAVAYRRRDGSVHTVQAKADGSAWVETGAAAEPPGKPPAGFALLADPAAGGSVLWTTAGPADPGRVRAEAGGVTVAAKPLVWAGPPPLTGTPAAALAGGYLRVVGSAAGSEPGPNLFEQRYELTGAVVGAPAAVFVPQDLGDTTLMMWVQGLLLASLMFTVGTSFYRQFTPGGRAVAGVGAVRGAMAADVATVTPAPLSARAAAGGIDLVPLVAGALGAFIVQASHPEEALSAGAVLVLLVGAGLYLAHTTVLEATTARSAGKWIMGLRVATPDGGRPEVWQLVTRNLLRVLDPLVWIVLSPLRQRTADVLAGTVVVREGDAGKTEPQP